MIEMKKKERNPILTTSTEIMRLSPFTVNHKANTNSSTSSQADLCAAMDATSTARATYIHLCAKAFFQIIHSPSVHKGAIFLLAYHLHAVHSTNLCTKQACHCLKNQFFAHQTVHVPLLRPLF